MTLVSRDILPSEEVARAIFHPLMFSISKNQIKFNAFLPKPGGTDVSTLRLRYASIQFCIEQSKDINMGQNQRCIGQAVVKSDDINVHELTTLIATPLDENKKPVPMGIEVYMTDKGLPMHADIVYSNPVVEGEPNTELRIVAKAIAKVSKYISA